jgi:hypothetical protein
MKYESINKTGYPSPPSSDQHLARKQFNELKARIAASSINKGPPIPNDEQQLVYQS